jgi:hypothetical protein
MCIVKTRCASGGSGRMSKGYIDPYSPLQIQDIDASVTVKLNNMTLVHFTHINVHDNRSRGTYQAALETAEFTKGETLKSLRMDTVCLPLQT